MSAYSVHTLYNFILVIWKADQL